jgi:salicylate hydroxylase
VCSSSETLPTLPLLYVHCTRVWNQLIIAPQHLGQGANQAFEDIDLLITTVDKHLKPTEEPSTATLDTVFEEVEKVRIPRTAEMVKKARVQGQIHVTSGIEECIARDNFLRALCADPDGHKKRFGV